MTSKDSFAYIRKRTQEVGRFFTVDRKKYRIPRLNLNSRDEQALASGDFRLEAWNALNKKIVANSRVSVESSPVRQSSVTRSGKRTPSRRTDTCTSTPRIVQLQVAERTAPLLDPRRMLLEATEALSQQQLDHTATRRRVLASTALKQLRIMHEGSLTARGLQRAVNPFATEEEAGGSRLAKSKTAVSVRASTARGSTIDTNRDSGRAEIPRELMLKYFEGRLLDMDQKVLSQRADSRMRFSILDLKKCASKGEVKLKSSDIQEAIALFKRDKLAFVYGPEFRGRYISRTHGDLLRYQTEHLAWKQRVNQEMSRACTFLESVRGDLRTAKTPPQSPLLPLRKAQSQLSPLDFKNSTVNLAYTFGGFTPARYAFKDPKESSFSVYAGQRLQTPEKTSRPGTQSRSVGVNTARVRPRTAISPHKRYIQELRSLVDEEKRKRAETEEKLRRLTLK